MMSAFAYHGVCMMMMTMTIDVWHTEVSVANGSQTGKQNTACCDLNLPFRFFPLGDIAICEQPPLGPRSSPLSPAPGVGSKKEFQATPRRAYQCFSFVFFSAKRTPSLFVIPKVGMLKRSGGPRTYALHHIYTLPYLTLTCTFYLGF